MVLHHLVNLGLVLSMQPTSQERCFVWKKAKNVRIHIALWKDHTEVDS
jgi:hypothetical protein